MNRALAILAATGLSTISFACAFVYSRLPEFGAGGLLVAHRRAIDATAPPSCVDVTFRNEAAGDPVVLRGWRCRPASPRRATLVYLHGIGDDRRSSTGVIEHFVARGLEVIAYDSRAHGESTGSFCTYGVYESRDLASVVRTLEPGDVFVMGTSLGGAVALIAARDEPRITAVLSFDAYSDLRTVATERAPWFFTRDVTDRSFAIAERRGHFRIDDASPRAAAPALRVPVLLAHGADDVDTPPSHSLRIHRALRVPHEFVLVAGAHHGESLGTLGWSAIDRFVERVLARPMTERL